MASTRGEEDVYAPLLLLSFLRKSASEFIKQTQGAFDEKLEITRAKIIISCLNFINYVILYKCGLKDRFT